MLDYHLDQNTGILSIRPTEKLTVDDFKTLTTDVDAYLGGDRNLTGLLLTVERVPGWESFAAVVQHIRFVRDHQKRIARVAVVTDNSLLKIPPQIAGHFAHPEFRVFPSADRSGAEEWLKSAPA
jgi:hypothetical protein